MKLSLYSQTSLKKVRQQVYCIVIIILILGEGQKSHLLKKRQSRSSDRNTCTLALVVDYRFYNFLLSSENNVITTLVRYIHNIMIMSTLSLPSLSKVSRVSHIDSSSFRPTHWVIDAYGNSITNQGLQIGTVRYMYMYTCV